LFLLEYDNKQKDTTLLEEFQNQVSKSQKEEKIYTPNTQIHDRSLSWISAGSSIKVENFEPNLIAHTKKVNFRLFH
jgi:hypothetical protein